MLPLIGLCLSTSFVFVLSIATVSVFRITWIRLPLMSFLVFCFVVFDLLFLTINSLVLVDVLIAEGYRNFNSSVNSRIYYTSTSYELT